MFNKKELESIIERRGKWKGEMKNGKWVTYRIISKKSYNMMKKELWEYIESLLIEKQVNSRIIRKNQTPQIISHDFSKTSIPKDQWGVHINHCCFKHGCKYGDGDCPVILGLVEQSYPCEECHFTEFEH